MNTLIETGIKFTVSAVLAIVLTMTVLTGVSSATGQDAGHSAAYTAGQSLLG